ncbi:hypothetical protein 031MP002_29 [Bacillus phage 031MP002]|nr:hypothetical protein 031MP003_30 [Bacillus phage 031MP003]QFG05520.1 hypothetical protein 031MP002_29 [Bacillus phage 031MP002]
MKTIYVTLDSEGFVNGWGSTRGQESDVELTLEENHAFFSDPFSYSIQDGQPVFSQEKKDSREKEREEARNKPTVDERLSANETAHSDLILDLAMKEFKLKKQESIITRQEQLLKEQGEMNAELVFKLSIAEGK